MINPATTDRSTMQAVRRSRYGDSEVLEVANVATPSCAGRQLLLEVRAASLNPHDWHMMTGTPRLVRLQGGLTKPKQQVLGLDVAGTVIATGEDVTAFSVGDEVVGMASGTLAEYAIADEDGLVPKPATVPFEAAAALPVGGLTALQGLRDRGRVAAGQRVLVNGAAGGVGTYAVQLAKVLGAEVTGVCSTRNVDLVRSLGTDHVVDYTVDDFAATGETYDVVLDNVGNRKLADIKRVLEPGGTYVVIGAPKKGRLLGPVKRMVKSLLYFAPGSRRAVSFIARSNQEDLTYLAGLLGDGSITSVIDRTYRLAETAEAMRHLATGHARGKIIIVPGRD